MVQSTAIEIHDLKKSYGDRKALVGVSLQIPLGQKVALLGPNGAGKTTLFKSISGGVLPNSGTIRILDVDYQERQALQPLGLVPQEIALYHDLTVLQNLRSFGALHGLKPARIKERSDWALRWAGLEDRRHHLVQGLSGGMQRRLNLACSCMHEPKILILDEPTVGVDPQSRLRIFQMLSELHAEGATVVLTTHQLEEAQSFCDRIIMIDHGQIIADGTLDALVSQTIGHRRRVFLKTQGEMSSAVPELVWAPAQERWLGSIDHVATDLTRLIADVSQRGAQVIDIEVRSPSLQDVFLHLTGRELRA